MIYYEAQAWFRPSDVTNFGRMSISQQPAVEDACCAPIIPPPMHTSHNSLPRTCRQTPLLATCRRMQVKKSLGRRGSGVRELAHVSGPSHRLLGYFPRPFKPLTARGGDSLSRYHIHKTRYHLHESRHHMHKSILVLLEGEDAVQEMALIEKGDRRVPCSIHCWSTV